MRLAQLARKVDSKPEEIRKFILDEFGIELDNDPNVKLSDEQAEAVQQKFEVAVVDVAEEPAEIPVEAVPAEEEDTSAEITVEEVIEPAETVAVKTTTVDEILAQNEGNEELGDEEKPFVEAVYDENAELIKAPKIQLEGVKVVGKIDLPVKETAVESSEEKNESESGYNEPIGEEGLPTAEQVEAEIDREEALETVADKNITDELDMAMAASTQDVKSGRTKQSKPKEVKENIEEEENSIYKDKNGIYHFTQEQLENRKKRLAELSDKKKQQALKDKKKRHYKDLMRDQPASQKKKKKSPEKKHKQENKSEPKGIWGKFLAWLND